MGGTAQSSVVSGPETLFYPLQKGGKGRVILATVELCTMECAERKCVTTHLGTFVTFISFFKRTADKNMQLVVAPECAAHRAFSLAGA